jgi:hypothetical protein
VNNAAINIGLQVSLWYPDLHSFRNGITGSYGSFYFSFLRNLLTVFHNDCTYLHSYHQCIRISCSWCPCQHLFVFLMIVILIGVRRNLNVVLICISFMAREVEHFFTYLLAICTSSFENSLFNSRVRFFRGLLVLWGLSFLSSL